MLADTANNTLWVLTYEWLNPKDTPAKENAVRTVPLGGNLTQIQGLSSLDPSGGVFAASTNNIWWIPVIKPLTTDPPTPPNNTPLRILEMRGSIQALHLTLEKNLYLVEWFNQSNNVWRFRVEGGSNTLTPSSGTLLFGINSTAYPFPPADRPVVTSITVNPNNRDVYVGLFRQGA
ncbi:hypothetical protein HK102_007346, partial [Quaeritorhiza haematococci]